MCVRERERERERESSTKEGVSEIEGRERESVGGGR